ncbi:tRNAse Z TRZ4, mitochondrial-like isoform X1 [Chenopodium quinoa]|uniref:tRNAse Z TRZ4, mitochondrial-like isoform X1 n=1 Tax=Chenopodium quinoa TaxID=63459 RepID=UPI000B77137F|nr:tRNAse Z TRZ4, mitochondrial-like isoform X1 [Chenopodium quinoa]
MKRNKQMKVYRQEESQSSNAYVQILGTGMDTHDTMPSILLFFDNFRIIFNAGEGLQRFCAEHKIKLSKIDYVCLSRVCSETIGGLPGLLLTLAGIGEGHSVKLRGPSNLKPLVHALKSFIPHASICAERFGVNLSSDAQSHTGSSLPEGPFFVCGSAAVKVSAILLQPCISEDSSLKPSDVSVVYICELAEIKGKFHNEKADALGLNPGPKRRELKNGKSVKSDRLDIMVHPSDVIDPSTQGPVVLIVDCPTESHAGKLFITQSLGKYYANLSGEALETVNCVVHLTPASVVQTINYQNWMKKFGSVQHIMAGYSMKNMNIPILKSSARITNQLSYLCPQFFPAPDLEFHEHQNAEMGMEPVKWICDSVLAENLLKFTLLPHSQLGLDKSNVPGFIPSSQVISDLLLEIPEIVEAAQQISQFWCEPTVAKGDSTKDREGLIGDPSLDQSPLPSCLENIRRDDAEIVLLGTCSSQPSKYRNVSSIFVNLFAKGNLLLDCGEGTLAQLKRRYGMDGAADAVKNLRCIWISHIHADHHAGLVRILALRRDLLKGTPHEPLHVIGPKYLESFLYKYKDLEDIDMQFLDCRSTSQASWDTFKRGPVLTDYQTFSPDSMKDEHVNDENEEDGCLQRCSKRQKTNIYVDNCVDYGLQKSLSEVLKEMGLARLISFPVVHCPESFGVILKARERVNNDGALIPGWKVVYSGDTRPCTEVIQAAEAATLLIHEATFEDDLVEEAIARNHSTSKEAMEVGSSAGAYRIILTHFSQRYPKIPSISSEINLEKASIDFDLMSVNLADLPILPRILPYLKLLFKDDITRTLECDV